MPGQPNDRKFSGAWDNLDPELKALKGTVGAKVESMAQQLENYRVENRSLTRQLEQEMDRTSELRIQLELTKKTFEIMDGIIEEFRKWPNERHASPDFGLSD